jgi:hypothetical protein
MIISLRDAKMLPRGLNQQTAREIFGRLTGKDVNRMLVREREWSPQQYEEWLDDSIVHSLLNPVRPGPFQSP